MGELLKRTLLGFVAWGKPPEQALYQVFPWNTGSWLVLPAFSRRPGAARVKNRALGNVGLGCHFLWAVEKDRLGRGEEDRQRKRIG